MSRFCWAALVLIVALSTVVPAQVRDTKADKSMIIALENAWNQAQIHRDGDALNRLVADTFVYTDWDGTLSSKA